MSGGLLDRTLGVLFRQSGDSASGIAYTADYGLSAGRVEGKNWDRLAVAPVGSAYLVDADEAPIDGPALIYGFQFIGGTSTLTLDIYDAASATGDPVFKGLAAGYSIGTIVTFPCAIKCSTKPFCDIGGTSPKVRLYAVPLVS